MNRSVRATKRSTWPGRSVPLSATPHGPVKWWRTITMAAAIVLAMGVAQTSTGRTLLQKAGLFEQPSNYTSLAFLSPQILPQQINSRQANVPISFGIRNVSQISQTYEWSMLVSGVTAHNMASGEVSVPAGREATITRAAQISCTKSGPVQVTVRLAHPSESIDSLSKCTIHGNH